MKIVMFKTIKEFSKAKILINKLIEKLPDELRQAINNASEKVRGILEKVIINPAEAAILLIKLPIHQKIMMLLVFAFFAKPKDGTSQTNPNYPAGYNYLKFEIYNALPPGTVMNTYADQIRYAEEALDNSYQNRCLTMTGVMHEGFDDSSITVEGNLPQTFANFYNYFLVPNNMPNDVTYIYQASVNGGTINAYSTVGEAYAEEQNYITFAANSIDENNPNYKEELLGHEVSHAWGENPGTHTKGNEPVDYQGNYPGVGWLDQSDGKSLGAAGPGTNKRLGAYTTSSTDAVADANGWVYVPDPNGQGYPHRIHKSELVNTSGAGNVNDGITDFIQNNPYRIYNIPLTGEYASHVPVAPSFNLNGNLLSITNQGGYNKHFEIFANSGENIDVDYEWYIYYTSNAADGSQINQIGFKMDEVVDLEALGLVGEELSIAVMSIDGNKLSTFTPLPAEDTETPNAVCQTATVELGSNGQATITPEMVDGGSTDNVGIVSYTVSPNSVDCDDLGNVSVTLTVTDAAGNTDFCTTTVNVQDLIDPNAVANTTTNLYLDSNGNATLDANDVNNGSSDNCTIATMTVNPANFSCSDIGVQTVAFTVTDNAGNSTTIDANVNVQDNLGPEIITQDLSVELDANGNASITAEQADNGTGDNCELASISVSQENFNCEHLGVNTVTFTATDANGNISTDTFIVTVLDNINPVAQAQDLDVELDENGNAIITAEQADNGSNDNCDIASMSVNPANFSCSDIGINTAALTVVDNSGNSHTTNFNVNVEDAMAPEAIGQNLTLNLNGGSSVSTTAAAVNNGSSDNCSIADMTLSQYEFTEEGVYDVDFTVTDDEGNSSTTTVQITVIDSNDSNPPTAICQEASVDLDENGQAAITPEMIDGGSWDEEGDVTLSVSPTSVDCDDLGNVSATLTVTDESGNTDQCTTTIAVNDVTAPEMIGQNIEIDLAETAPDPYFITPEDVDNGSSDNCDIVEMTVSPDNFEHTGVYNVTLTGVDDAGNESETDLQVTAIRSVGLDDNENFAGIRMFPNPTDNNVYIETSQAIEYIKIYNSLGQMVYENKPNQTGNKTQIKIQTENWIPSIYIVNTRTKAGVKQTTKLIVR